jgi:hypothetical protein
MAAYTLTDVHPVLLDGGHDASGSLEVLYESVSLQGYDDELHLVLETEDSVQMKVADFTLGSSTYNVYSWSIDGSGGLTAWSRVGSTSVSATVDFDDLPEEGDVVGDFVTVEALSGDPAPTPTTLAQATAQGGRRVRVKIRKGDVRPIPPVRRS